MLGGWIGAVFTTQKMGKQVKLITTSQESKFEITDAEAQMVANMRRLNVDATVHIEALIRVLLRDKCWLRDERPALRLVAGSRR